MVSTWSGGIPEGTIDGKTGILVEPGDEIGMADAIVALAQTMVIITHGIDLSVSSMIGLVAMMVAFVVKQNPEMPVLLSVILGMALGAVLGSVNGLIITFGKVPPIIATLGTLSIYRGLVFFYSQGTWINSFELPANFKALSKGTPLGLPNMVIIAIVVAVVVYYFLNYTRTGRDLFAVGSNPDAAQFAGIRKQRIMFLVYLISGLLSGLAAEASGLEADPLDRTDRDIGAGAVADRVAAAEGAVEHDRQGGEQVGEDALRRQADGDAADAQAGN